MSIGLFIFFLYILIIIFNWIQNQVKKSHNLNQNGKSTDSTNVNQNNKENLPEYNHTTKEASHMGKNEEIVIDDEVKGFYKPNEKENLTIKPLAMEQRKDMVSDSEEDQLFEHLPDNILINGIILSEILAPPRALKPYNFKGPKRLR